MESIKVIVVSSAATYRKSGPDLAECPPKIFQQAAMCHLLRDYDQGYYDKNIRLYDSGGNDLGTYSLSNLRVLDGGYVVEATVPTDLYIIPKNRHSNYLTNISPQGQKEIKCI